MPVALELGDALRSWCNPATEDAASARFVRPFFEAAIEGYAEAAQGFLTPAEWSAIPRGALTITVELAARFCADALRESYFGWNRARYESASAHNQARTRGQLLLADGIRAELPALEDFTARAFAVAASEREQFVIWRHIVGRTGRPRDTAVTKKRRGRR